MQKKIYKVCGVVLLVVLGMVPVTKAYTPAIADGKVLETKSLNIWLEELAKKESGNRARIKVLDVNDKYSYGCLQFQEGTWIRYMKMFKLRPYAEDHELMNEIYDCELQKDLAALILLNEQGGWRHWTNTVLAIGKPPI